MDEGSILRPDWNLPDGVQAFVTTRVGGSSEGGYAGFNLAAHVGDAAAAVAANRQLLRTQLQQLTGASPLSLQWLAQVHGTSVVRAELPVSDPPPEADAVYTTAANLVLGVLTADCLPVLFASTDGREIAVAHAGWRGLCNGVLEATLENFRCDPQQVKCWLGPAIGPCHFEVGDEVRDAFLQHAAAAQQHQVAVAFVAGIRTGKWQADLYALARLRLQAAGVGHIAGEAECTVCEAGRFYSYRRQPVTGRFATLIVRTG